MSTEPAKPRRINLQGRRVLLKRFTHNVTEIEDLIKQLILESHVKCDSQEITILLRSWKALFKQIFLKNITDAQFANTTISKFLATHQIYNNLTTDIE